MSEAHHLEDGGAAKRKKIWIVFGILSVITTAEFVIAFIIGRGPGRNALFMALTVLKAFYIVAEFMHLKHEAKSLILTIMLPLSLVLWLIVALLMDGSFYLDGWFRFLSN